MDKWKEIWNKEERVNKIVLETLIKADGFDSGAGSLALVMVLRKTSSSNSHKSQVSLPSHSWPTHGLRS